MFKKLQDNALLEICVTSIVIITGLLIVKNKLNLTDNAKKDVLVIKELKNKILEHQLSFDKEITIPNHFNKSITFIKKDDKIFITSSGLPYQSCVRYALDGEDFDSITINDQHLYFKGEIVSRDKALKFCLLNKDNSVVEYTIKNKII